jgi:hypothetical protein
VNATAPPFSVVPELKIQFVNPVPQLEEIPPDAVLADAPPFIRSPGAKFSGICRRL